MYVYIYVCMYIYIYMYVYIDTSCTHFDYLCTLCVYTLYIHILTYLLNGVYPAVYPLFFKVAFVWMVYLGTPNKQMVGILGVSYWMVYLGPWGFKILGLLGFLYCWYTFFGMSWDPPVLRMGSWVPKVFDILILDFSDMGHNSTWWNSDHPQNKRNTVPLIRGIVG